MWVRVFTMYLCVFRVRRGVNLTAQHTDTLCPDGVFGTDRRTCKIRVETVGVFYCRTLVLVVRYFCTVQTDVSSLPTPVWRVDPTCVPLLTVRRREDTSLTFEVLNPGQTGKVSTSGSQVMSRTLSRPRVLCRWLPSLFTDRCNLVFPFSLVLFYEF